MRILAIRLARFGDVVLLLPALGALKARFPESQITFLTGHRCSPLGRMCPAIDDVIAIDRVAMRDGPVRRALIDIGRLVRDIRRRNFDLTIDFHGFRETNLLTWLSGSDERLGLKRFDQSFLNFCFNLAPVLEDKSIHVAEMFMQVVQRLGAREIRPLPSLAVPQSARESLKATLPAGPLVALYVDAPVRERIWPPERFAAVADHVAGRLGASVVVLSGPQGAPLIQRVTGSARFGATFRAFSNLQVPELAAVIESAQLLISNDTGPMHLGPALGVPTMGLFSVGIPRHFRPTGIHDGVLQGNPIEEIHQEEVIAKVEEMWATVRPGLRR